MFLFVCWLDFPVQLHFKPYTAAELQKIICQRVESACNDQLQITPSAIEYCARRISAVTGDVRKALDVCRWVWGAFAGAIDPFAQLLPGLETGHPVTVGQSPAHESHTVQSETETRKTAFCSSETLKSYAGDWPTVTGCPVSNPGNNWANGL